MSSDEQIFRGYLTVGSNGEEDDILFLGDEPLAEILECLHNKIATVRYYISDKEVELEEAQELFVLSLFGQVEAEYRMAYSEYTGYLWTDEELKIGGHDLLEELKPCHGKYLILIADTDNEQERQRIYNRKINSFKSHLSSLNQLAEEIGEDRDVLIKRFDER